MLILTRRKLVVALAALLLGTGKSWACRLSECTSQIGFTSLVSVLGMHDMEEGRWVIQAAPGLWNVTGGFQASAGGNNVGVPTRALPPDPYLYGAEYIKPHGYDGSLAIKREFSPNWGLGLMGSFASENGNSSITQGSGLAPDAAYNGTPGGAGFMGGTYSNIFANEVALMATWDPFANPNGFRMPISFGPYVEWSGENFSHSFVNPNNGQAQAESAAVRQTEVGALANISFDFLLFKNLRVMPALLIGYVPQKNDNYNYVVSQAGAVTSYPWNTVGGGHVSMPYVTMTYRPWDLSVNYVFLGDLSFLAGNTDPQMKFSNYSITMTKKFGGKSDSGS